MCVKPCAFSLNVLSVTNPLSHQNRRSRWILYHPERSSAPQMRSLPLLPFLSAAHQCLWRPPPAGFLIGIGVFRCLYRRLRRRIGTKNTTASRCYETQCKRDNDAAGCSELCHYSLLFRSLSSHIQLYQSLTRGKLHIYQWTHQGRSPPCCPSVFYIDIKQQRRHFIMRIHR